MEDALSNLARVVDDDEYQNGLLPESLRAMMQMGAAVDVLPDARGPFGLSVSNPIPVNGAIGELAYLSKLRTVNNERLLFHRLGSVGTRDLFEAVT